MFGVRDMGAEQVDGLGFCLAGFAKYKQILPGEQSQGDGMYQFLPFGQFTAHLFNQGVHLIVEHNFTS